MVMVVKIIIVIHIIYFIKIKGLTFWCNVTQKLKNLLNIFLNFYTRQRTHKKWWQPLSVPVLHCRTIQKTQWCVPSSLHLHYKNLKCTHCSMMAIDANEGCGYLFIYLSVLSTTISTRILLLRRLDAASHSIDDWWSVHHILFDRNVQYHYQYVWW